MKTFEILCIDQKGAVTFKEKATFLKALSINENLLKSTAIDDHIGTISDTQRNISIKVENIDTKRTVTDLFVSAFLVKVTAEFDNLESFRLELIRHLRFLKFSHLRVLTDEISSELGEKIYPHINKIENSLRRYIVKFFITKIGIGWFDISVPSDVKEKIKKRFDNEPIFTGSKIVDTDVTLIDFDELGEIITRQTSVYSKVDDLVERIKKADSLETLKSEISGNYPKYFADIFGKQNFPSKWKTLFNIRNKVAHNNYLFKKDLIDTISLCEELEKILQEAELNIDKAILTVSEKQAISKAIAETVAEQQNSQMTLSDQEDKSNNEIETLNGFKLISEDVFIDEFENFERSKNQNWTFIALSKFLDYLESKGYNRQVATTTASILEDEGEIQIGYEDNPFSSYKTASIKRNKNEHNIMFAKRRANTLI